MAFDFPQNPKRGSIFTIGSQRWKFNGIVWNKVVSQTQGPVGPEGRRGATGPAGPTGPVEEFVASLNGFTGDIITEGLTFAFAGISVGTFGITTDGAISFSGTTGTIQNPGGGNDAKIDISAAGFVLGRFHRLNGTSTIGDVNNQSNGTRVEVEIKNQIVSVTGGVLFPVKGISLGVGLTFPDGSFQSSAHAPHDFVSSFNGATGAVEGVNSFNGLTGAVSTTALTLQVAGISSSGDITSHGGTLEANNFVVDGGKIFQKGNEATTHIDMSSAQDITIKAGDDINLNPDGLSSFVFRNDGTNITVGRIFGGGDGRFISVNDDMAQIDIGDLDTVSTNSKIRLSDNGISLFDEGGTQREVIDIGYRRNTDVATFTIDASSAIATGAKTNSLYRIPYNATLKKFDVKTNATGGLTAAIRIAGPDFANPLTSGITGCSLGIEGLTGSSTVFNQASVTAGNFILLDIFSNNSGASAAQAFLTFESRL